MQNPPLLDFVECIKKLRAMSDDVLIAHRISILERITLLESSGSNDPLLSNYWDEYWVLNDELERRSLVVSPWTLKGQEVTSKPHS